MQLSHVKQEIAFISIISQVTWKINNKLKASVATWSDWPLSIKMRLHGRPKYPLIALPREVLLDCRRNVSPGTEERIGFGREGKCSEGLSPSCHKQWALTRQTWYYAHQTWVSIRSTHRVARNLVSINKQHDRLMGREGIVLPVLLNTTWIKV